MKKLIFAILLALFILPTFGKTSTEWIVFDHCENNGKRSIWKVQPDGNQLTQLTDGKNFSDYWPEISHNGKYIAFCRSSDGKNADLYLMDINNNNIQRLTYFSNENKSCSAPSWSYDNELITFTVFTPNKNGSHEIFIINKDGTGLKQLTNNDSIDSDSTFEPITGKILFLTRRNGIQSELYIMNQDGSDQRPYLPYNFNAAGGNPMFTSDGKKLIVLKEFYPNQIISIDTTDYKKEQITHGYDIDEISVSPDNKKLVFDEQHYGDNCHLNLYISNIDGTNKHKLIDMYGGHASWGGVTKINDCTDSQLQAKYNEGYEAGKKYCKENPSACGITTSTTTDCSAEYQKGYDAGKQSCSSTTTTTTCPECNCST